MSSAAPLIDVSASQIKATYEVKSGFLTLEAKGDEYLTQFTPFFQREELIGGLLFSIRAFSGGFGPVTKVPPFKPFEVSTKLQIALPEAYFNSKSVLVETAKGTWVIPIEYLGFGSPDDKPFTLPEESGNVHVGQIFSDVLPPIYKSLLEGAQLKIVAQVPKVAEPSKTWVKAHYNPAYFNLVDSTYEAGTITWTFEWAKRPDRPNEDPQVIDVTTTTISGLSTPVTSRIIQGYLIAFAYPVK